MNSRETSIRAGLATLRLRLLAGRELGMVFGSRIRELGKSCLSQFKKMPITTLPSNLNVSQLQFQIVTRIG